MKLNPKNIELDSMQRATILDALNVAIADKTRKLGKAKSHLKIDQLETNLAYLEDLKGDFEALGA